MKYLLAISVLTLCACSGEQSKEPPEQLADIEICLDQGGEWQGECVFQGEYCLFYVSCSKGDSCPCAYWTTKD